MEKKFQFRKERFGPGKKDLARILIPKLDLGFGSTSQLVHQRMFKLLVRKSIWGYLILLMTFGFLQQSRSCHNKSKDDFSTYFHTDLLYGLVKTKVCKRMSYEQSITSVYIADMAWLMSKFWLQICKYTNSLINTDSFYVNFTKRLFKRFPFLTWHILWNRNSFINMILFCFLLTDSILFA